MTSLIDSGVWIAAFNKKDAHHAKGKAIVSAISEGKLPDAVITDYIFNEVVTYTRKKLGFDVSKRIANALLDSSHLKIIWVDGSAFMASFHIFQKYDALSFTDAHIVVVISNMEGTQLFSFDSGFDSVKDVVRLEAIPTF